MQRAPSLSTLRRIWAANSPGDNSAGSMLRTVSVPASICGRRSRPSAAERDSSVPIPSSNRNSAAFSPRCNAACRQHVAVLVLPMPDGPIEQRVGAGNQAAAHQAVQLGDAAADRLVGERRMVFGGDQAWVDQQPARRDGQVVEPAAKCAAAQLHHAQPAPLAAEIQRRPAPASRRRGRCCAVADRRARSVLSSSSSTVQRRWAKNCFNASIWRR